MAQHDCGRADEQVEVGQCGTEEKKVTDSKHLVIYHNRTEGSVRAVELWLSPAGKVESKILEASALAEELTEGVGSYHLGRIVMPSEGQVFLDALREYFVRSTAWSAVEE